MLAVTICEQNAGMSGVLSHPQCMSACMPASTPAWVKNLQDTFRLAPTPV